MSPWPKRPLGLVVVALALLAVFQLKSQRSGVAQDPRRDVAPHPATPARAELSRAESPKVVPPSFAPGELDRTPVEASPEDEMDAPPVWRLSGVVMTPQRELVPQAEIWLDGNMLLGTADAAGRFELSGVTYPFSMDDRVSLTGRADGYQAPFETEFRMPPSCSVSGLALVIVKTRDVTVRVIDAQHQPVAGIELGVMEAELNGGRWQGMTHPNFSRHPNMVTDENGRAVWKDLPQIDSTVEVWNIEYTAQTVPLDALADGLVLNLGWKFAQLELSGFVHDEHGLPIESAGVSCSFGPHRKSTTSASDGTFHLALRRNGEPGAGVPQSAMLTVRAKGYQSVTRDLSQMDPADLQPLEFVLVPGLTIAGIVLDHDGEPIVKASVRLTSELTQGSGRAFRESGVWVSTKTTEDGRFQIHSLWPGVFQMEVRSYRLDMLVPLEVAAGTQDLVVRRSPENEGAVSIRMRARAADSGQALREFSVWRERGNVSASYGLSGDDAWAPFPPRMPGSYTFIVGSNGYLDQLIPARMYEAGRHDIEVSLEPSASLRLRVVDSGGLPMSGVLVALTRDTPPGQFSRHAQADSNRLMTGYDGRCVIDQAPVGEVEVRVQNKTDGVERIFTFTTSAGDTTEHVIEW